VAVDTILNNINIIIDIKFSHNIVETYLLCIKTVFAMGGTKMGVQRSELLSMTF